MFCFTRPPGHHAEAGLILPAKSSSTCDEAAGDRTAGAIPDASRDEEQEYSNLGCVLATTQKAEATSAAGPSGNAVNFRSSSSDVGTAQEFILPKLQTLQLEEAQLHIPDGFCIYNTCAIAARFAIEKGETSLLCASALGTGHSCHALCINSL